MPINLCVVLSKIGEPEFPEKKSNSTLKVLYSGFLNLSTFSKDTFSHKDNFSGNPKPCPKP